MHLFIEKGMRGGISYISKRHSQVDGDSNLCIGMQIICMIRQ